MRHWIKTLTACASAAFLGAAVPARANETDNFTCRGRLTRDSTEAVDTFLNARIAGAVAKANERGVKCGVACLVRLLQEEVGGSVMQPPTFVPRAKLIKSIERSTDVERCHLEFRDTIYGAHKYNHPWLLPFLGRAIFVADSIRLSGRVVGLDKLQHFLREGLGHWRDAVDGMDIATSMANELGSPGAWFGWTEYGLKGLSVSGVLAYADLAAEYSGFRFWRDLLSIGGAEAAVAGGSDGEPFVQQRPISLAAYVNDAWDEAINCSTFEKDLAKEVATALTARGLACPIVDCRPLALLPDARLYVNPACLASAAGERQGAQRAYVADRHSHSSGPYGWRASHQRLNAAMARKSAIAAAAPRSGVTDRPSAYFANSRSRRMIWIM
jgi:hypothetical protein